MNRILTPLFALGLLLTACSQQLPEFDVPAEHAEAVETLTSDNFETLTANGVTVVEFWAKDCGPCHLTRPRFAKVAADLSRDGLTFGSVDVDAEGAIAFNHSIRATPTMLIYENGVPVAGRVGIFSAEDLRSLVSEFSETARES
ncbi:MAG: thioredoxin family protein [Opitutales bacterium]